MEVIFHKFADITYRRYKLILILATLLTIGGTHFVIKLVKRIDTDIAALIPDDYRSVRTLKDIEKAVGGVGSWRLLVQSDDYESSQRFVNDLVAELRKDEYREYVNFVSYQKEVDRTTAQYREALADLNRLQKQTGFLSPADEATQTSTLLTGLLAQAMELDSRIFVLRQSNSTGAPSYQQLLNARESLSKQIDDLRQRMAGSEDTALSNLITEYSQVETNRIVAEKLFETSRKNYDQAFTAALRQALYLTVFIEPALPEDSYYPRRFVSPLLLTLGFLVFWALLSLVWASVEDHRL